MWRPMSPPSTASSAWRARSALETAKDGITVNAVCPGFTETPLLDQAVDRIVATTKRSEAEARATLAANNPQGRFIQPQEVADVVLWLCARRLSAASPARRSRCPEARHGERAAAGRRASDSKARLRLWIRLLRASRLIEGVARERLKTQFNATLPRFDVMAALYRKPDGMLMSEISRFLMVSNGNVTGIVDRLVADGLVARAQRNGDRRTSFISLTRKGRARSPTWRRRTKAGSTNFSAASRCATPSRCRPS